MPASLQDFIASGVFAYMLIFLRIGTAVMIMPGVGDSFVSARIRLHFALGLSLVLFPLLQSHIPQPVPATAQMVPMVISEFIIGLFFGTVARIFMTAMDTAGMVISIHSGLGSAQLLNPLLATQGSLIGAFMSVTGVVVLFVTNMHYILFTGLVESYNYFPVGHMPDSGSMAQLMTHAVSAAFAVGVKIASPFIILTLLLYVGMGVMARVMPQVQIFMIALPLQVLLSIILLMLCLSAMSVYFLQEFQNGMTFLSNAVE